DQEFVPQCLIELDCLGQIIAKQRVEWNVGAAAFKAAVVEQLAQRLRIAAMISRKLHSFVSHLADDFYGANQILGAFIPDRIKLEPKRNLLSAIIFLGQCNGWAA